MTRDHRSCANKCDVNERNDEVFCFMKMVIW